MFRLCQDGRSNTTIVRGDGIRTAAKKRRQPRLQCLQKVKSDKVVAFCNRHCNVIPPFVTAPGNRNEPPLLREALPKLTCIAHAVGLTSEGGGHFRDLAPPVANAALFPIETRN